MTESTKEVIKVQSILYHTDWDSIIKFFNSVATLELPANSELLLHLGDCSGGALLDEVGITFWRNELAKAKVRFEYTFFSANLGPSKGHNTLFTEIPAPGSQLLIINPDTVFPFHLVSRLCAFAKARKDYGIIEGRQLPMEHPKEFDLATFETSWASTACCLFKVEAFEKCGGFDEIFFMYCDDVDISWRIRATGYKVYYCPDTFVYHSKRLLASGMEASWAERHYGLIYSMVLRAKYGRSDLNAPILQWVKREGFTNVLEAYENAIKRMKPATLAEKKVALFAPDGNFANHRWQYEKYEVAV